MPRRARVFSLRVARARDARDARDAREIFFCARSALSRVVLARARAREGLDWRLSSVRVAEVATTSERRRRSNGFRRAAPRARSRRCPRDDRDLNSSRANRALRAREEAVVKRWKSPVRAPPRRAAEALRALRSVPFRPLGAMSFCDKAFSCAWLADDLALIGTKDNRLFELEIDRRGRRDAWREIELGREDAYTRNRAMEIAAQWVSRHTPQALRAINVSPPFLAGPYGHGAVRAAASRRGGAHACSVSSTREHIVCSGGPSHNIVGFRRDEETECLVPRMAFSGHEDVVFDVGFIGRDAMASASRDCTVKVWQLPKSPSYDEIRITPSGSVHPIGECTQNERVRGVKVVDRCPARHLATCTSSGHVLQLDAETLSLVHSGYQCRGYLETCCLATDGQIVAVGSRTHIGFVDFRSKNFYASVALPYGDTNSARSLSFHEGGNLLTIGGGRGLISFYDVRMRKYLVDTRSRSGAPALQRPILRPLCRQRDLRG